ncbi:MAG: TerB family tellurite resistance protein [Stellaceae bacterium]
MIESIRQLLSEVFAPEEDGGDPLEVALAALLVETATSDHHFDERERVVIGRLLERRFDLSPERAGELLAAGAREAEREAEIFHLIRTLNERLSHAERVELIEMLWEVAYADGVLDQYEDSLLRRVGGLTYVDDRERGLARRRVLRRLGIDPA